MSRRKPTFKIRYNCPPGTYVTPIAISVGTELAHWLAVCKGKPANLSPSDAEKYQENLSMAQAVGVSVEYSTGY